MHRLLWIGWLLAGGVAASGCLDDSNRHIIGSDDVIPPGEPRDVYSVTGDGEVTLYWSPPADHDVAGFSISISADDRDYYRIADVGPAGRHFVIHGETIPSGVPFDFVNGDTYFLGVTAFDVAGNESPLSETSTTFDTPRPAGRGLQLFRADGPRADQSGYDFSRSPYGYAMSATSLFTDIYFIWSGGIPVMRTPHAQVVEMQDMGLVDFDDPLVGWLADEGWDPRPEVALRPGHVMLVKLYEETREGNAVEPFHVAKFQVVALDSESVSIDWAYQIAPNNRELKPAQTLPLGEGVTSQEVQ